MPLLEEGNLMWSKAQHFGKLMISPPKSEAVGGARGLQYDGMVAVVRLSRWPHKSKSIYSNRKSGSCCLSALNWANGQIGYHAVLKWMEKSTHYQNAYPLVPLRFRYFRQPKKEKAKWAKGRSWTRLSIIYLPKIVRFRVCTNVYNVQKYLFLYWN